MNDLVRETVGLYLSQLVCYWVEMHPSILLERVDFWSEYCCLPLLATLCIKDPRVSNIFSMFDVTVEVQVAPPIGAFRISSLPIESNVRWRAKLFRLITTCLQCLNTPLFFFVTAVESDAVQCTMPQWCIQEQALTKLTRAREPWNRLIRHRCETMA